MQSLQWYLHRLGRMSPAEMAYRTAQAARSATHRWVRLDRSPVPAPDLALQPEPQCYIHIPQLLEQAPYTERAQALLAGCFSIFDLQACQLGEPAGGVLENVPQWNRDPLTGRQAPLRPAATLDYRDESLVGNIKYLWEPNRHLHLPQLAQAYALTGEFRYALAVKSHVNSWIEQCPRGRGPNWSSSLELAIRLINWSIAWQLLGGASSALFGGREGHVFRDRWLRCVYQHVQAICGKLSRFSSANNHLIGEAAGVWIASITWGYWPQMRRWGRRCGRILEAEAIRQNAEDGGNREQAFAYQQFVLDFLLLAGLAGRAVGEDFSPRYWQRIEAMLSFLAAIMDVAGQVPMVGDADDGYVVQLSPEPQFDNFRSLLATGAVLFDRMDFAGKAGGIDHKTRWLLGSQAVEYERRLPGPVADRISEGVDEPAAASPRRAFHQSGYFLLGDGFDTPDEVRMLVDAGPLGYLSLAAHGHADALSVVLSVGGREVLVDPGTYAYHTEPQWRRYFRSTRAHNTVEVDGQDQSSQSGNFMWSRHANARCLQFQMNAVRQSFVGEHDGYRALGDPVTHRRQISYCTQSRSFEIVDTFECIGRHEISRRWHFAESLEPALREGEIQVRAGLYRVRLVASDPVTRVQRFRAGTAMEGGWVSRRFGVKAPATCVSWISQIQGTTSVRTRICCERV